MAAGNYENTAEYLENEKFIRLTNNRKYIKVALRHLMMHYKGEQLLHKKQIEFIVKNCIEGILLFHKAAMETYENLPEKTKQELDRYYENYLAFSAKTNEGQTRKTPPDIIESFNRKQEENNKRVHDTAKEYLENN